MVLRQVLKKNIYIAGVNDFEANNLAAVVHLSRGTLPFKYLGVPLAAKKLYFSQCNILIDKITERAQSWMALSLSQLCW